MDQPFEVQIWECDPLVIEDDRGDVRFAARCKVEFTPADPADDTGFIKVVPSEEGQWTYSMEVDCREPPLPIVPNLPFYKGVREGRTLFGHDDEGTDFTWYVNEDAKRFLLDRKNGVLPVPPEREEEDDL
jgi:hypothetical protein